MLISASDHDSLFDVMTCVPGLSTCILYPSWVEYTRVHLGGAWKKIVAERLTCVCSPAESVKGPDDTAAVGVGGGTTLPGVLQVAKDARDGVLNTDSLAAAGGAISANEL